MIDYDELTSLSWEQKKKYRNAINCGYFDTFQLNPRSWKHSFAGAYLWKHPDRVKLMNTFREIVGDIPVWEDVTDTNLKDLLEELFEQGLAPSSIRTMCGELKAVLNDNYKSCPCPRDDFNRILSVKRTVSQFVYLTRKEMEKVIRYKPQSALETFVKRNFVVQLLTGARRIDAERLSLSNCDMGTGMLSYVPKKTPGIVVTVPVDERLRLRDYLSNTTKRATDQATFNDTIRAICRKCDIDTICSIDKGGKSVTEEKWKLVSSHTARRSFATNLYLAGISLEDIALMMGHGKNIETTKRYICAERKVSKFIASYFKPERKQPDSIDAYSYNKGVDDVLSVLTKEEIISPDGLVYRAIEDMKQSMTD